MKEKNRGGSLLLFALIVPWGRRNNLNTSEEQKPGQEECRKKNSCEKRLCEIELLYQFKHSFGDVEEEQESLLLLLLLFGAVHNPLGGTAGNFPRVYVPAGYSLIYHR